ncbi:alpha-xylosidase [Streptomyces turgidiscabies]|uniref:alpha-D-xyloside xylohydrolase n=1 Tax=Streptomyces turgidiscabies (strain Car8) TaxID=698760 RepID=L7F4J1_STRT8|nr:MULTISPECIES: alpha-xylosidase [Streptomyces]ELP66518.1 glycosyl hydrolase, family 31 [Streptomyces turgidiscabies Car8]MDX3494829.1 alpha-xylosidase [Streptomyces turgidiscabies]GAQ71438.1 alpha-xylosidase [Streptomyces turgidiscabies]
MKFTDGYWLMRPGVTARFATEVTDVRADEHRMTLFAPVKHVTRRGGTLNSPLLTVECWSPAEGVIGVRTTHHAGSGRPAPEFALPGTEEGAGKVHRDGSLLELTSGELTLRVNTSGPWRLEFTAGGRVLTSAGERGSGFVTDADGRHHMVGQLALGVGESVYGLGERFTPFVKNGQTVDIWQADGGTSSEQAYKNIPFHLTDRGYGVFVNHPGKVSYEVGSESVGQVQFSVEDQSLEYFVVHGPTPKEILERYTALTGRPALPPAWALGLWLTTSFTTDYDEATVSGFIDGMAERGIPLSVFHFDCFWMRAYQWCDFDWDPETFPDPEGMLARLKERGLRISAWINPYIAQKSPLFEEGMREGYLVRRPDGSVWQWDLWQAGMALVDFTHPAARDWYTGKLRTLLDQGVDCFKTDFGERVPTDVVWHDGSDPERMHNYYVHLYNQAVFELLRAERGEGEALLFARSATAGGQQYPVHWGGDCDSTFGAMAESLRGGLSLGLSGFGFWSHDIGGFEGTPTPAVFKRWVQFGLLSSHSRLHGSRSYRVPWDYGEEAVEVTREFTLLKHRLAPYLQRAAQQAHTTGVPVMRAMLLEFPDDPTAALLDRQYMLGDDLLVAPVFSDDGTVEYYVPEGTWTNILTGAVVTGPRWVRERHDFHTLPLLARPDSVIPLAADDQRPVSAWAEGVELRVHAFADGAERTVVVPSPDGPGETARFRLRREGARLHVETDSPHPWRLRIGGPDARPHTNTAGPGVSSFPCED